MAAGPDVYFTEPDSGILWNSIAFKWPCDNPLISERDRGFEAFSEFAKKKVF